MRTTRSPSVSARCDQLGGRRLAADEDAGEPAQRGQHGGVALRGLEQPGQLHRNERGEPQRRVEPFGVLGESRRVEVPGGQDHRLRLGGDRPHEHLHARRCSGRAGRAATARPRRAPTLDAAARGQQRVGAEHHPLRRAGRPGGLDHHGDAPRHRRRARGLDRLSRRRRGSAGGRQRQHGGARSRRAPAPQGVQHRRR